jgi:hypothetical protein
MRSWGSSAASGAGPALACALVLAAPAVAAPVDDFARASTDFARARSDARPRANAALRQRQEAAQSCLDVFRATPEPNREPLFDAYVIDVVFGAITVDEPLYDRFIARLEQIRLQREPALMAARRILRGQVAGVEALGLTLDDACTTARQWQAANWRTPPRSIRILRLFGHFSDAFPQKTDAAERRLRRAGHPRAAEVLARTLEPENGDAFEADPVACALDQASCP